MTTYRLYPTNPSGFPTSSTSLSDAATFQLGFESTASGNWLDGYWWPIIDSSQLATGIEFALFQVSGADAGTLVANSQVTSGTLTVGAWNYIALPVPLNLSPGVTYRASVGYAAGNMPHSSAYFSTGAGDEGITNGPLYAYGDSSGYEDPYSNGQMTYTLSSSNPAAGVLGTSAGNNYWLDVQLDTAAPSGAAFCVYPNWPSPPYLGDTDSGAFTLGTKLTLSETCTCNSISFFSPPGSTVLPSAVAIYNTSTETAVSGSLNSSPTWSGAAGSGWVTCSYSGLSLPAGTYALAVFSTGSATWFAFNIGLYTSGLYASGATNGPVSVAGGASGGSVYNVGGSSITYPATEGGGGNGEAYYVDAFFTPSTTISGAAALTGSGTLSAAGAIGIAGAAALTGSGTLTATASVTMHPAVALSGSGTLTASASVTIPASAALTGSGTLTATGAAGILGDAALSGSGTLTASATDNKHPTASLSGSGTLSAAPEITVPGACAFTGSGTMTATASVTGGTISGAAALSGTGVLSAAPVIIIPGACALSGSGSLSATPSVTGSTIHGAAALSGSGVFTANSHVAFAATLELSGVGAMSATGGIPPSVFTKWGVQWNVLADASAAWTFNWDVGQPYQADMAQLPDGPWIRTYPS